MYKIYEFYKEPCDDKTECLVADMETEESAYECMLGCFTARSNSAKKYYSFADNAVHADIIRAKLWSNIDRSKKGFVLYTVYAFNKTDKTIHVYPMRVFTEYRDALDEAMKFGSFCNDWTFVVDTSIYDAIVNYTIHHADRVDTLTAGSVIRKTEANKMKPEYYIYTWLVNANFSYDLCKSVSGYYSRRTAERIAFYRYNHLNDQIRYCVALTDEEAYAKLKRQKQSQTLSVREEDLYYICGTAYKLGSQKKIEVNKMESDVLELLRNKNYTNTSYEPIKLTREDVDQIDIEAKYYIYSWMAGALRSNELSKSPEGYYCRGTAEKVAKIRFEGTDNRIQYCVALTDEEAFVEMTRRNLPNAYFDTDDML